MECINLLLVDDEEDFLKPLEKRLARRGFKVFAAADGEEALGVLGRETVDVVVLDYKMPGMNGLDMVRAIKDLKPLVEVIMLTGHANMEVAMSGMEVGAFDYLIKPCDLDSLVHKIQDAHQRCCLQKKRAVNCESRQ